MSHLPLPYLLSNDPAYAAAAAAAFTVDEYGGAAVLRGPCPRCGTSLEVTAFDEVVRGVGGADPLLVLCDCREDHPGRPDGRSGCGAYWNFLL
ncbi:hypothetical protein ACH4D4_05145 [Streptomyces pristinaespiralis]|uniref:hypothetical protein n=1 Tax=Streptomyces pristinaespiralis TaxID=38300 RepID=UPI0037B229DE